MKRHDCVQNAHKHRFVGQRKIYSITHMHLTQGTSRPRAQLEALSVCTASGFCADPVRTRRVALRAARNIDTMRAVVLIAVGLIVTQVCTVVRAQSCTDNPPSAMYSCAQQKQWGKCSQWWMTSGNYCAATCGRCSSSSTTACTDIPPNSQYTCLQQKGYGTCNASWMTSGNYCATTCGRCIPPPTPCSDVPPGPDATCAQRKQWNQCNEYWITSYNYCAQVRTPLLIATTAGYQPAAASSSGHGERKRDEPMRCRPSAASRPTEHAAFRPCPRAFR